MEALVVFIVGLCVGSFLNVCIYRFPREESIFKPVFSFCPQCGKTLKWYDNIPLLSYLFLRRKCRFCNKVISFRYFLVELMAGVLFLLAYLEFGLTFFFFKVIILLSLCIVVSFIDIDYRAIPGGLCVLGIIAALVISLWETVYIIKSLSSAYLNLLELPIVNSIKGLFLCVGLSYSFKLLGDFGLWIYLSICKKESVEGEKESLGLGDVDFLGMVGAFIGWKLGFLTFFLAPLVSVFYGIYILIFRKSHLIAYLPFLSIACFISIFWGYEIIELFFHLST